MYMQLWLRRSGLSNQLTLKRHQNSNVSIKRTLVITTPAVYCVELFFFVFKTVYTCFYTIL